MAARPPRFGRGAVDCFRDGVRDRCDAVSFAPERRRRCDATDVAHNCEHECNRGAVRNSCSTAPDGSGHSAAEFRRNCRTAAWAQPPIDSASARVAVSLLGAAPRGPQFSSERSELSGNASCRIGASGGIGRPERPELRSSVLVRRPGQQDVLSALCRSLVVVIDALLAEITACRSSAPSLLR